MEKEITRGTMLTPELSNILLEILKVIGTALISGLTIALTVYVNRLQRKIKRNEVQREIDRYAQWALKLESFTSMTFDQQKQIILEDIRTFVMENGIAISDTQLELMIEQALTIPKSLQLTMKGLKEK